jgi:hypothetical protein
MIALAIFYAVCAAIATYPAVRTMSSTLPSRVDPLVHLWTLRWYKTCLAEGRLPFHCPEIQYPVGAPLGFLPPMHYQALLYLPLSCVISNDVLCYNLIWFSNFVLTGIGTFVLAWYLIRDRCCAVLAGLLAMLSGPMTFWSHGELEQMTLGWFPIFLVAWMRWVDQPSWRRWSAAVGTYLLLAMSAPYFVILGAFPAGLYVVSRAVQGGRAQLGAWLRCRFAWLVAFCAAAVPVLALLFSSQIWALLHGYSLTRPSAEFNLYATSLWAYLLPTHNHMLGSIVPATIAPPGVPTYLGAVTIALLAYALCQRAELRRRSFVWLCLAMLVVLSLGAYAQVGRVSVPLPAHWLRRFLPIFKPIRVPARFSLFVAVVAAVVAAGGLRSLLERISSPRRRAFVLGAVGLLAFADLMTVPYANLGPIPPQPACYEIVRKRDPDAILLEVPQLNTAHHLAAACTYWQSFHRGRTATGYTAFFNTKHEELLASSSPFSALRLADPSYLRNPEDETFDLVTGTRFHDQVWIYTRVHGFDYIVLHHAPGSYPDLPVRLDRIKALLEDAKFHEDDASVIYDVTRLPPPTRPVVLCTEGWHQRVPDNDRVRCAVAKVARLAVYNPNAHRELTIEIEARALRRPKLARLMIGDIELARWQIQPEATQTLMSPPFKLPAGLHELTIECDTDERPHRSGAGHDEPDPGRFSFWATGLKVSPATTMFAKEQGSVFR